MNIEDLNAEELNDYMDDATEFMSITEVFDLLLLLIDEKPGASITVHFERLSNEFKEFIQDFSDQFDLNYLIQEDSSIEQGENISGNTVFLCRDSDRLEMLRPLEDVSEEDIGLFLGYPEGAVEAFQSSTGFVKAYKKFEEEAAKEDVSEEEALKILEDASEKSYGELFQEKLEELKKDEVIDSEDINYLELVSYVPEIDESSIEEAIQEGRRREKLLEEIDEKIDTSLGKRLINQIL